MWMRRRPACMLLDEQAKRNAPTAHRVVEINSVGIAKSACGRRFHSSKLIDAAQAPRCDVCEVTS